MGVVLPIFCCLYNCTLAHSIQRKNVTQNLPRVRLGRRAAKSISKKNKNWLPTRLASELNFEIRKWQKWTERSTQNARNLTWRICISVSIWRTTSMIYWTIGILWNRLPDEQELACKSLGVDFIGYFYKNTLAIICSWLFSTRSGSGIALLRLFVIVQLFSKPEL